jgi:hypothetical protein
MLAKLSALLIITLCCAPAVSQSQQRVPAKRWRISNLEFTRFINGKEPKLAAHFELDHRFYEKCPEPNEIATTVARICGVRESSNPVYCSSWGDYNTTASSYSGWLPKRPKPQDFYSCHNYRIGVEGQGPLYGPQKAWLK